MRILFLHLSDTHFEKKEDYSQGNVKKIIDSLNEYSPFDDVIFILSGDLANSGGTNQYKSCCTWLIGNLVTKFQSAFPSLPRPKILVVPGNHDICNNENALTQNQLQAHVYNRTIDTLIDAECKKLYGFYDFSERNYGLSRNNPIHFKRTINCNGFCIEAHLLNSALFSLERDEDKGLHYFPGYIFSKLQEPCNADLTIMIMHHSHHWLCDEQKSMFEEKILPNSHIVFYGHEHRPGVQEVSYMQSTGTAIVAGGELCNRGNWGISSYNICALDTNILEMEYCSYTWNSKEQLYIGTKRDTYRLHKKTSYRHDIKPSIKYLEKLFCDSKNSISEEIDKYFVFPRIQQQGEGYISENEFVREDDFFSEILSKKRIYIVGGDNSGKTTLLKRIFASMSRSKAVLLCGVEDITSGNRRRIARSVFLDIYGDNIADYNRFLQLPINDKAIIIDDVHRIKDAAKFSEFLKDIQNEYGYIILSSHTTIEFDILERWRQEVNGAYSRYEILPCYSDKRKALIYKLVPIFIRDKGSVEQVVGVIIESLKRQRLVANYSPYLIIQYVKYFCSNIAEATRNDGGIFGKVFEANIVNLVTPHLRQISVDKLFIIIDKIAYYMFSHKEYPIRQENLSNMIINYNELYGDEVSIPSVIKMLTDSNIMTTSDSNSRYVFCNKSHLAYFIAREIRRRYQENGDNEDLKRTLEYACFGINADILILLTYIAEDRKMVELILDVATQYVSEWPEFSIDNGNVPYITDGCPTKVQRPSYMHKKKFEENEVESERKTVKKESELKTTDIFDYDEDEIKSLLNQIIRAYSLTYIVSRCLPNFEYMLLKDQKARFVDAIYKLPLKVFYRWAIVIEKEKEGIVQAIKEINASAPEYDEDDALSDEEIMRRLQLDSINFLLNILNVIAANATKENTFKYLDSFDYESNTVYSLHHLMMIERREKAIAFIKEAARIYDSPKCPIVNNLVERIVQHFILYSKNMKTSEMQSLEAKYFGNQSNHQKLLVQRAKAMHM